MPIQKTEVRPLAGHVGRDQEFEALGRRWRLGRWTRAVWRDFLEWARPRIPDPRHLAAEFLKALPATPEYADVRNTVVVKALEDARGHLAPTSPPVLALLATDDGMIRVLQLLLRPAHGEVTEEDAYELMLAIGQERAKALFEGAAGTAPPPKGSGESPASPR